MPRSDRSKWAKDKTRMQVAALVDTQTGHTVDFVRADSRYNPVKDKKPEVRALFAAAAFPRVFDPVKDAALALQCANPACTAPLSYVPATMREGDTDRNSSHFRSRRVSDHALNCMFRNEASEQKDEINLRTAIDTNKPILINVNGLASGHYTGAPRFQIAPGLDSTSEYDQWLQTTGKDGYHIISVHSIDEMDNALARIKRAGGENALSLVWVNNSTLTVPYDQLVMNTNDAWRTLLTQMVMAAEETHRRGHDIVQLGTRLVDVDVMHGAQRNVFNGRDKRIMLRPQYMGQGRLLLEQGLWFHGLADYGVGQAEGILKDIVDHTGHKLHVMATPTLRLPRDSFERARRINEMRQALAREHLLSASDPFTLAVGWSIGRNWQKQIKARPLPALAPSMVRRPSVPARAAKTSFVKAHGGVKGTPVAAPQPDVMPGMQLKLF